MRHIILFLIVTVCFSCDPYGGYQHIVKNAGSHELTVNYRMVWDTVDHVVLIPSGTQVPLEHFETINGIQDLDEFFLTSFYEEFKITPSDTTYMITTDYMQRANWHYKEGETTRIVLVKAGENVYTLKIGNGDIQPKSNLH